MRNADGKAAYIICFKDICGRRKKQRTNAGTLEDAERVLRKIETDIDKAKVLGLTSTDQLKPMTFGKYVEEEFLPQCKTELRPATAARYRVSYNQVKDTIGGLSLREINAGHIDRYKVSRMTLKKHSPTCKRKKGQECACPTLAAGTVNRDIGFIGAVLNRAVPTYLDRNPLAGIKRLKYREDNIRERTMTPIEEVRIMEALEKSEWAWLRPIFIVGRHTLMRLGEILRLKHSDILDSGFLRVSKESKAHKVRMIPVNPILRKLLDAMPRHIIRRQGQSVPSEFLFLNGETGDPYTVDGVSHAFRELFESVGATGLWFHDLRRTGASELGAAGVPDRVTMKLGGWSTPGMVNRYSHMKDADLLRASDLLAKRSVLDGNGEQVAKKEAKTG
jgi:integrase